MRHLKHEIQSREVLDSQAEYLLADKSRQGSQGVILLP